MMEMQNEPPTLSEAHALTLLQQHCSVLHRRLVCDASRDHGAHATQKWMALRCVNVTDAELRAGLGYELRVAMDIVNALCACRGFSPHRNGRFWRDVVSTLWIDYALDPYNPVKAFQPPTNLMLSFHSEAFSCFSVEMNVRDAYESDTNELAELWRQIAWTNASAKCPRALLASRDRVLNRLRVYAVRSVRTLKLELTPPRNVAFYHRYHPNSGPPAIWNWQNLYDAVRACAVVVVGSESTAHEISIAIPYVPWTQSVFALYTTNLRQVRQLVASSIIQCLRLDAVFLESDDATETQRQLVQFGELLHTLLIERHSLTTLKLEGQQRHHLIAATCSVLPMVSCLQELNLVDVDDGEDAGWLSYALRHPLRKHDLSRLTVRFGSQKLFKSKQSLAVWKTPTPLRAAARKAVNSAAVSLGRPRVRADAFKWFATGTTFAHVSRPTAELFANPAWVQRAWKPVQQGAKLEVVATVDSMDAVGVVVPGWGLRWIKTGAVCIETTVGGCQTRGLFAVKSLSLVAVPLELPLLLMNGVVDGASLVSLSLRYWGSMMNTPNNQLASLLASCPNLESLSLEYCDIPSVLPLVRAYKSKLQPCRISSLTFACCAKSCGESNWWGLTPLFNMLASPDHPGAHILRHLSVWLPSRHRPLAEQTARVLAVNRSLETVFVVGRRDAWDFVRLDNWTRQLLSPFQDQVLCDASACCIALLSVVCDHSSSAKSLANVDALVAKTIMTFAGPTRVRTVRWLCGRDSCFPSLPKN